jgi:hypothetical protein
MAPFPLLISLMLTAEENQGVKIKGSEYLKEYKIKGSEYLKE